MNRRKFIWVAGGGAIAAASVATVAAGGVWSSTFPAGAVQAWEGPVGETDPRRRALAYAITAPNPHNLQPWQVDLRESGVITLFTDPTRVLPETDPLGRQILIGHGAFLELLVVALAQQGLAAEVTLWPQGELPASLKGWDRRPVARIVLRGGAVADPLFGQILKRRTPKSDFDTARAVSAADLQTLMASAAAAGLLPGGSVEPARLPALRELCWESAKVELLTPRTMMESIRLTRVGPREILKHRDGISLNSPFIRLADTAGMFDRNAPPAEGSPGYKAAMDRFSGHSRSAMGFAWLSTAGNSRSEQVRAGRAYVRMQLKATEMGLGVHPMSQALQEFAEMQPHFERAHQLMLGKGAPRSAGDETLQMFVRLGYTKAQVPATPRRPLAKFVAA
ncbi:MAG: twin-arginine translocation pathway signal protein [Bdellovibrionales bacterium]|nr:twin-arginine translocation pathway signal protein [Ramlibacter sp.]